MLVADFNTNFKEYVNDGDIVGANDAIMIELGSILVNNKQNFIDLLNESGIEADISMSNKQLIGRYMENAENKHLLLGSSLLANMQKTIECDDCSWSWKLIDGGQDPLVCHKCGNDNAISSFDNSDDIFDEDVKTAYVILNENLNDEDDFSEVLGSKLIKKGRKELRNLKGEGSASNDLKLRAKLKMQQSAIAQQKTQIQSQKLALKKSKKTSNVIIIATSSILLLTIGFVIYLKKIKK